MGHAIVAVATVANEESYQFSKWIIIGMMYDIFHFAERFPHSANDITRRIRAESP